MSGHLPADYRFRASRSDFWLAYDEVFSRRTHRLCGKGVAETCDVERWNRTLHRRLGRFVRGTLSCSKCERMHAVAVRLCVFIYILISPTPAMDEAEVAKLRLSRLVSAP